VELQSGQILKSKAYGLGNITFVYHFAVVIVENGRVYVMHNTREQGVITESYTDYSEDREVVEIIDSDLINFNNEYLKAKFQECKGDFDWNDYNCEHFIDCMLGERQFSEQKELVINFIIIAGLAYLIFK
tara:strand:+ start:299 stop:688 length:390 start_codon:yes stop_codon:yes gene_type:complete